MDILNSIGLFLQSTVQMGTILLFATLGGILCERVGHLNLGIEGMMLMGAVIGFFTGYHTGSGWAAFIAAAIAGGFGALIYAVITVTFLGNQIVTGLVLSIFGTGFSSFVGLPLSTVTMPQSAMAPFRAFKVPLLSKIPVLGPALFEQSIYVHIGLILAIFMYIYINKTRFGLNLRAIGENPASADASGININLYKYIHIIVGGMLCGLGGAYLTLVYVPLWQDGITSGMGWIAVTLIIFSSWNPIKAIFSAYLFGALRSIGFKLQNIQIPKIGGGTFILNSQLLNMLPYIMTIVVLVIIALRKKREEQPPAWLSLPYFREDR
ncbi:MAG: ABC transporter permease [Clostridiales bacterium]|jgi:simple sugar transport system permease protein|nr:ABC transporter permease [Clostridiales bacterium]